MGGGKEEVKRPKETKNDACHCIIWDTITNLLGLLLKSQTQQENDESRQPSRCIIHCFTDIISLCISRIILLDKLCVGTPSHSSHAHNAALTKIIILKNVFHSLQFFSPADYKHDFFTTDWALSSYHCCHDAFDLPLRWYNIIYWLRKPKWCGTRDFRPRRALSGPSPSVWPLLRQHRCSWSWPLNVIFRRSGCVHVISSLSGCLQVTLRRSSGSCDPYSKDIASWDQPLAQEVGTFFCDPSGKQNLRKQLCLPHFSGLNFRWWFL